LLDKRDKTLEIGCVIIKQISADLHKMAVAEKCKKCISSVYEHVPSSSQSDWTFYLGNWETHWSGGASQLVSLSIPTQTSVCYRISYIQTNMIRLLKWLPHIKWWNEGGGSC